MKRVLIALMLLASFTTMAQKRNSHHGKKDFRKDLSVEQLATLKTKKMTLALDLTKSQQKEVMELNLAEGEFRKAKMEERKAKKEDGTEERPTTDERFAFESERLDKKLAHQEKMKQILNDDQYQLWKKLAMRKNSHHKKRMGKEARRG